MPWFKIDDRMHSHPKFVAVSLAAAGLWARAGSYCSAYQTDGQVPKSFVRGLGRGTKRCVDELVQVGLWSPTGDGWVMHNFTEYNPSKSREDDRKATDAERKRQERRAKAESRPSGRDGDADQARPVGHSEDASYARTPHAETPTRPDPTIERGGARGFAIRLEGIEDTASRRFASAWMEDKPKVLALLASEDEAVADRVVARLVDQAPTWEARGVAYFVETSILPGARRSLQPNAGRGLFDSTTSRHADEMAAKYEGIGG